VTAVIPKNAANKKVAWKSSDKKIAKVSKKGVVKIAKKAKRGKKVTIICTAKDGSKKTAKCKITVK